MHSPESQMSAGERLRRARVLSENREVRGAAKAAEALGTSRPSLYEYESGKRDIPLKILLKAVEVFGRPLDYFVGRELSERQRDKLTHSDERQRRYRDLRAGEAMTPRRVAENVPEVPRRSFATEAERIAYTLGIIDLAQVSNGEVARALSSATAALLAPIERAREASAGPPLTHDEAVAMVEQAEAVSPPVGLPSRKRRKTG